MKGFQIKNQCSEDWSLMSPDEKGAFCSNCSKSVHDFTNKSLSEINKVLIDVKGTQICGRINTSQEEKLNQAFVYWESSSRKNVNRAMLFSLLVVFGLSIVSCSNEDDLSVIQDFQIQATSLFEKENNKSQEDISRVMNAKEIETFPSHPIVKVESKDTLIKKDTLKLSEEQEERLEVVEIESYAVGMVSIDYSYYNFIEDSINDVEEIEEYDGNGKLLPNEFSAFSVPNPTVSDSKLDLKVAETDLFRIMLFSQSGEFILDVENKELERGSYLFPIDLSNKPSGVYLVVIQSLSFNETLRIIKQ